MSWLNSSLGPSCMSATEQADRHATERRIPVAAMLAFTKEAFRACGLPEADADIVAKAVIEADLTGSDAHGIFRLAQYVRWLREGRINPQPGIKTITSGTGDRARRRRQRHGPLGNVARRQRCGRVGARERRR